MVPYRGREQTVSGPNGRPPCSWANQWRTPRHRKLEDMREYWKSRPKAENGRPHWRKPEQLWEDACRYFDWAVANPLQEDRLVTAGIKVRHVKVAKVRAFTIQGLCAYLGIRQPVLEHYATKPGFDVVVDCIRNVIYTQKFENAAAGLLVANIISRDLGLADRTELTGKDGGPMQTEDTTKRDAADFTSFIARLAAAAGAGNASGESEPESESDA